LKVEEVCADKEYGGEECVCREEGNTVTHYTLRSDWVNPSMAICVTKDTIMIKQGNTLFHSSTCTLASTCTS